jgi:hypothetical protein
MPSDDRERSFENALAAQLRAGAQDITHAECSDAETLAAYHEGSLSAEQVASLKTHIAGCERCRHILTALEATDQISAPVPSVIPQLMSAPKSAVHILPVRKRAPWQWIAPAGALAAALLVWVAVHENTSSIIPAKAPSRGAAPEARQTETVNPRPSASSTLPSPSLDSTVSNGAASDSLQASRVAPQPNVLGSLKEHSQELAKQKGLFSKEKGSLSAAKKPAAPPEVDQFADGSAIYNDSLKSESSAPNLDARNDLALTPPKAEGKDKTADGRRDAPAPELPQRLSETSANVSTAASAPQPSSPRARESSVGVSGGIAQQQEISGMSRFKNNAELRLANSIAEVTISAPGGQVSWRVGQAGIIEFSSDAGKSWTVQPSGVITDLFSGSAPTDKICWVVGRGGTLLRTTDAGAHWQKTRPPTQEDLHSVFAVDARQAIASSANAKYQTTDGGITWKKLPPE